MQTNTIDKIREEIDKTDKDLLTAFLKRMELSKEVAQYKEDNSIPIENKQRERQILSNIAQNSGDLKLYSHRFFSGIMEISKAYQGEIMPSKTNFAKTINDAILPVDTVLPKAATVACQGIEGAYSGEAADRMFPCGTLVYFSTFEAIFDAVEKGFCEYGILPIENSSRGSVRAVYDLLQKRNVSIIKSEKICIRHELLVKPGTKLTDIKEIYSHEQALGQCSEFISSFGKDIKIVPVSNTAVAAKSVSDLERKDVASISSHECAGLYGLEVLNSDIQDSDNNYTRFICITKETKILPGSNKISLILTTAHEPGALYNVLAKFSALGVNILKLESAPIPGHDFEFIFFFDLEASVNEPGVISMLSELERSCSTFKFLGNYSEI